MTNKEKAELYWAYAISYEKIAKKHVELGIASEEDVNEILEQLYDRLHECDIQEFSVSSGCEDIMYRYLGKGFPKSKMISLTDIARDFNKKSPSYVIQGWLRSRNTIEFLRIWESKNNPNFNEKECDALLEEMKSPSFTITPKQWIRRTKSIGLFSKQGKNGGTFAHPDISIDFHMWLYPEFRMALIKLFRKNKDKENLT